MKDRETYVTNHGNLGVLPKNLPKGGSGTKWKVTKNI